MLFKNKRKSLAESNAAIINLWILVRADRLMTMLKFLILLCVLFTIHDSFAGPLRNKYSLYLEIGAVKRFREYIRIDTSQEENIKHAVDFWVRQANELGLPYAVYAPAGKPIFVITVEGSDPSLPSIMLNSHMDVVKADESEWTYPPFAAYMDSNGDIFGRGTQDTKDVGIQYMEAIRRLRKNNITLARTLHVTIMPDEETGGKNGMKTFVKTKAFESLNVGFALDEGLSSMDSSLFATYVDRRPWQMEFTIYGEGGHGLAMPDGSAMEKAQNFINTVMEYRETQKQIMKTKNSSDYTGYSSVNINMLEGGLAVNIIPSKMKMAVDMRLATDANVDEMQSLVDSWVQIAGNNTEIYYKRQEKVSEATAVDDSNPYWVTLKSTLNDMGIKVKPIVCPATSDMISLRNRGIPALGFTTKANTIGRLHAKDEYQNVETFMKGIDVYTQVIKNLGNLQPVKS
ncbi:hypothetical protein PYW08_002141 [Mythimna loreyi]|uniref:Uncharacterized protein n=1 Tax=Mythimna loreyi TaxID=667449 RepID=A0ACC2R595_9NEOP|nr:hypothetical protein PYW08_002141 [Mythimna loreyi]